MHGLLWLWLLGDAWLAGPASTRLALGELSAGSVDARRFPGVPASHAPRGGRIWWVAPGGKGDGASAAAPSGDLARAVRAASKGDTVWVRQGRYVVAPQDDEWALRIERADVTVAAPPGERAVVVPAQPGATGYGLLVTGDRAFVDGLSLEGFKSAGVYFGREGSPQEGLVLARLSVRGGTDGVRSLPVAADRSRPLVRGLLAVELRIVGAAIGFNCGEGPCDDVRLERITVRGSDHKSGNSGEDAIAFEQGNNVAIVDGEVSGAGADGVDLKVKHAAVVRTAVRGVGRNGIKLWHGGEILGCVVYRTGADAAIVLDDAGDYRIAGTTVAGHGRGGEAYTLTAGYDHPRARGRLAIERSLFLDNGGPLWVSGGLSLTLSDVWLARTRGGVALVWARSPEVRVREMPADAKILPSAKGLRLGGNPALRDARHGDYRTLGAPAIGTALGPPRD